MIISTSKTFFSFSLSLSLSLSLYLSFINLSIYWTHTYSFFFKKFFLHTWVRISKLPSNNSWVLSRICETRFRSGNGQFAAELFTSRDYSIADVLSLSRSLLSHKLFCIQSPNCSHYSLAARKGSDLNVANSRCTGTPRLTVV